MISTVRGSSMVIYEEMFAGIFKLATEGLMLISDLPKRLVEQMRLEFSESRVTIHSSSNKKYMKLKYRFLHDIIAKALTAKAGSFDAVTQSRFDLMVAIMGGIKINWSKILFMILKAMVAPSTKQAQGFSVQLILLLKGVLGLKLGEFMTLPFLSILSAKSVGTYLVKNTSARVETAEKKKYTRDTMRPSSTKVKRLEVVNTSTDSFVQLSVKRKCTTIGRAAVRPIEPIQMARPTKRKLILFDGSV
ncbi:hypothetical protein F511_08722 [Dorcoceras hygrometricum]|uniref:Uncharacterized protein n=1 Tax=Dorcoceras hygrometricum TaxID=472368 RepID=A0A2Z7A3S6_9LAMI|nr:hypothetical protein F511_08722 [Dorcoceras hygrometricum]